DRRGGPALDGPRAIVIAPDGTRYVGGVYGAGADFGEGPVASEGGDDIFVLAIEPSGGTRWVRTFGSPGTDGVAALAIGPDGEVYVAGYAQGAIDVGGGVQSGG